MVLAFDWTNVHLAGAFLIGWLFGTIVTMRLLRVVSVMLRNTMEGTDHERDG